MSPETFFERTTKISMYAMGGAAAVALALGVETSRLEHDANAMRDRGVTVQQMEPLQESIDNNHLVTNIAGVALAASLFTSITAYSTARLLHPNRRGRRQSSKPTRRT